jgi:hypothetical protein
MLDPLYYLIDLPSFDPATLDGIVLYCRLLSKVDRFRRQYDIFPGRVIITWVSRNSAGEVMVTAAPMPTSSERHRGRAATRQRGKSDAAECAKGGDERVLDNSGIDFPIVQMAEPTAHGTRSTVACCSGGHPISLRPRLSRGEERRGASV